ncbi:AraC family transcriptional regulator [Actinoallomurus sp. NPDC052274]|uniref:AraC family transcriptional regulator n=1 Tax=Actinoallomurus sp. NPDC052274 TaxID=3155420 RepID=UPI003435A013
MDVVAGLLNGPRAEGAFLLRSSLLPPWALRVRDKAPLTLVAMVRGTAWVIPEHGGASELGTGDVAILRGPDPYVFADDPVTAPQAVIHPGQRCTTPDGGELSDLGELGVRTWGNAPEGATVMVTGTYQVLSEICRPLLDALPPLVVIRGDAWEGPLVPLLAGEVVKDEPGQDAVLDRLLDLLLVAALRTWFSRPEADPPPWYRAQSDPVIGPALRLLHDAPERPWTVARLAAETNVSRAALARRFTALVGEPPMGYLTAWRIALAADLLRDPGLTIGQVAERVGYGSSFALSTAFKRIRGVSPREHRAAVARAPEPVAPTTPWRRRPA